MNLLKFNRTFLCAVALLASLATVACAGDASTALRQKYTSLLNKRADELQLQGDRQVADAVRAWPLSRRAGRNYLLLPPEAEGVRPAALAKDEELAKLQQFYAEHLFRLARAALADDDHGRAYQLACEALHADPAHKLATAVVNLSDDNAYRTQEVRSGWEVETEHFEITTTDTKESAEETGRRLEELHLVWRQLFADYWFTQAELERRFDGGASRLVEPNHKVMLFANKTQYVDYLKRDQPGIEVSLGYYAERPRTAYFYNDSNTVATQFHEATHQLFHERQRRAKSAGIDDNFWVVEGVATYMESMQKGTGYYVVGGPGAYRLQFARYRALTEQFYVPLNKFVAMGRAETQAAGENLPRLYSQAAGLAHFFMDAEDGKYRRAFVEYLDAVYRDKADAATLARLTGKRYEELDAEYLKFLRVTDDDLAQLIPGENVPRLYLGRTKITDRSFISIAGVQGLERLDVGYCKVTDAGLKQLPVSETLVQLNLEHTPITDAALEHIGKFRQLRELDLSGCDISDAGIQKIAERRDLEILWLTSTSISDAGLAHLHGLKKLKFLDVDGTNVTADGWAKLKQAVPTVQSESE